MKQGKLKDARFNGLHVCKIPKEHKTFQRIMVENVKKGKKATATTTTTTTKQFELISS